MRAFAEDGIEPYHARVRDAVLRRLTLERLRELHRALADALRPHAADHAEALVEHLAACGEGPRQQRLRSALLAFDRAAALYAIAIHHGGASC